MNPIEALKILDNILSQINSSREGHAKIQEAIQVIKAELEKK